MAEYIEREAVLDYIDHMPSELTSDGRRMIRRIRLTEYISDSIPAADVVPVVRCAECKWFQINMRQDGYLPKGVPECECRHWCGPCDPTDFCSYGARMDGDGDV